MKIIITGVSSYVGKYLSLYFLNRNYEVIGISRTDPNIHKNNFKFIKLDLEKEILDIDCDILIHSAGEAKLDMDVEIYYLRNIKISYNIKQYLKNYMPTVFLLSTHKVYGNNKSVLIDENSDIINTCNYGLSKLVAEKILESEVIILRLPALIGKGSCGWLYNIIEKLKIDAQISIYDTKFNNLLHLSDLSGFIHKLIYSKITKELFLLSAKNEVSSSDMILYLRNKLNSKSEIKIENKDTYYFNNQKMIDIYNPMDVYETINLFIKELN